MAKKKTPENTPPRNGPGRTPSAAGTYFLSLTVQNVRCFGDKPQTLDLSDGKGRPARWTILFGENGTGKTTLLQALAAFEVAPHADWFSRNRMSFERGGSPLKEKITVAVTAIPGLDTSRGKNQKAEPSIHTIVRGPWQWDAALEILKTLNCHGYGAGRRLSAGSFTESELESPCDSLYSDDAHLRNAEEWLLQLDYSASKESKFQERQRRRLAQIKDLLVGVLQVEGIRFTVPEGVRPVPFVEFKTPDGWVPLRQLGHGYRTTTSWVVDLASRLVERDPDNEDPLAQPAVVLVDEIDLHMHPRWQRHLMKDLSERFPNAQFVVTAHSPLIAQAAEDANLVLLRREGDHVVIENKMPSIHGWGIDQVLTSDLFGLPSARPPQLDALMQRRGQLLTKAKLTEADKKELTRLEAEIGDLPGGETAAEAKMLVLLREALDRLQRNENGPP